MRPFHGLVLMLLLVLLLATAFCKHSVWPVVPGPNIHRNRRIPLTVVKDKVRFPRENPEILTSHSRKKSDFPSEQKAQNIRSHHTVEVFPRDLRQKEKFIKHLTGPLYFNPRCRKHFYRLYHNTRDCTIPAYYKRCARLLTRLAGSPRCTEK